MIASLETLLPRAPRHWVSVVQARALLDQWAPVAIVRGLQGYGKTTLVSTWLRDQSGTRAIWMSAHAADDLDDFLTLLMEEARAAGFGDLVDREASRTAGETDRAGGPWPADDLARRVLRVLAGAARACAGGERLVLVIDEGDRIQDQQFLVELVQTVARHRALHLIVCSRGRHPVEAVASGRAGTAVISAADLRFTVTQISALARAMQIPLADADAEELHTACDGWPAVVALVLGEAPSPTSSFPLARAESYILEAILPADVEDRAKLEQIMLVALAARVSHRLVKDLVTEHDPDGVIALIESMGLAERRYDATDVQLVFPRLVQATLRKSLNQRHPDRALDMHRRLSSWFASQHDAQSTLFALRHAVLGRDWARADGLWTQHSIELERTSLHQIRAALDAIPTGVIASRPGMSIAREMAKTATLVPPSDDGWEAARRCYGLVSSRMAAKGLDGMRLHDLLAVGTGKMLAMRHDGDLGGASRLADKVAESATTLVARGSDPGDRLQAFHLERGITHTLCAEHATAAHHYQLSWHHARPPAAVVAAHAAANLALTYALVGDTTSARSWLDRHHSIDGTQALGPWGEAHIKTGARLARALLALDQLDARACQRELVHLGSGAGPNDLWPFIADVNAQFGLHYSDPAASLIRLDNAQRAHHHKLRAKGAASMHLSRARAELLLAAGEGQLALRCLAGSVFERTTHFAVPLARLHLLAGNSLAARRIAAQQRWNKHTSNRDRLELLLVKALAAHRMKEPHVSGELTRQALAVSQHTGILVPFTTVSPEDLDTLLAHAGETLDPHVLAKIRGHRQPFPFEIRIIALTPRERLLAECLRNTASRKEIADQLYVSANTVRKQLVTLYRKLNVSTREEALTRLEQLGFTGTDLSPR